MLKLRILTAIILIPLVLAAIIFLPQSAFAIVAAVITALLAWEWTQFIHWNKLLWRLLYIALVLVVAVLALFLPPQFIIALGAFFWFGIFVFLAVIRNKPQLVKLPCWLVGVAGVLLLVPFLEALLLLHLRPIFLIMMLLIVWMADIAAYFGGRAFGKRKLAPVISPNKTLEGVYIALIAVMFLGALFAWLDQTYGFSHGTVLNWISLTTQTFVAAVVGDLFESFLKRQVDLKDSGNILPGHGGVLDRLDSVIAAAPIFACGVFTMGLI